MNTCETFAALLDAYVDGELTAEEMLRVREHLDGCDACRAYVDDALAIRAAFPDAEDTAVPEGFADRVLEAIRAQAPASPIVPVKKKGDRRAVWARTALPLAACCAVVILLARGPLSGGGDAGSMALRSMEAESVEEPAPAADTAAPASAEDVPETEKAAAEESAEPEDDSAPSEEEWKNLTEGLSPSSVRMSPGVQGGAAGAGQESGAAHNGETADLDSGNPDTPTAPPAANKTPGEAVKPAAPRANDRMEEDAGTSGSESVQGGVPAVTSLEPDLTAEPDPVEPSARESEEEGWVEYGNVVFSSVVSLTENDVGDALDGFEGRPYSSARSPEDGVTGTGYALEPEDFQRILGELAVSLTPNYNPEATTELCCIVVTGP